MDEADGLISNILSRVGHVAMSAGAYVFDNDEDYLSGQALSSTRFRLHVSHLSHKSLFNNTLNTQLL